jgi:DNA modification methylase
MASGAALRQSAAILSPDPRRPRSGRRLYETHHKDSRVWLREAKSESVHAIVTDPPYGVREFEAEQVEKMRSENGGVWRIRMKIGGSERKLMPRFTDLSPEERKEIRPFFAEYGRLFEKVLVPGGHVVIASSPLLAHYVSEAFEEAGFEVRGSIIRVLRTFRGGFRPKGAEEEFGYVSSMPRGCWEPWLLFRKPFTGTLSGNLRKYGAGGLRRISADRPMMDLIASGLPTAEEREIASHPTLKPQGFLRLMVRAVTPMGHGTILDPFMGSGSTVAACESQGLKGIGIEADRTFYEMAVEAIPKLAALDVPLAGSWDEVKLAVNGQASLDDDALSSSRTGPSETPNGE